MVAKKKRFEFPNTFVIVFAVILVAAIATWIVPGGKYIETVTPDGSKSVLFEPVESVPQTWQVVTALYHGFVKQAGVIAFILIIGGAFWIVNSLKAVDAGIFSFLKFTSSLGRFRLFKTIGVGNIVLVLIMLLFSLFGAVFGMSEEAIAFTLLVIPLVHSLGYDTLTGVCAVYVAAHVGFAGAMLNPFTIGVAQNMAGVPIFSGIEYRTFCWAVLTFFLIVFVLRHANRVKRNASGLSGTEGADERFSEPEPLKTKASYVAMLVTSGIVVLFAVLFYDDCVITLGNGSYHTPWLLPLLAILYVAGAFFSIRKSARYFILNMLGFTILFLITGVLGYGWYIDEISGLFLALGIFSGIAGGYTPNRIVKEFLDGAKDIFSAALVVGLASGIIIILQDGMIIDSILNSMEKGIDGSGKTASLSLMYGIQTILNLFIPSATAKAAITMPVMAPFSDLIGLSRQATVMAFQFGDGFTNMITPTSGVLMAVLAMAKVSYAEWVKFAWKFVLMLIVIGFLLLLPTLFLELPGF